MGAETRVAVQLVILEAEGSKSVVVVLDPRQERFDFLRMGLEERAVASPQTSEA
jgi:hypothetical protein